MSIVESQDDAATQPEMSVVSDLQKRWSVGTLSYSRRGLVVLFCWLLWGDFAWSMKERAIYPVFQLLLTQHQASNTTMAVLLSVLPSAISLIVGPVISFHSDRYRSGMGRRIPFLMLTTPFAALAMIAISFSPYLGTWLHALLGNHSPGIHTSVLIFFGLFWVIFEIATLAANALYGAFVNDVVPASLLGRFFGLFRAVSLIAGIIFNFWLIKKAEDHPVWLFISIATLYGVGFTFMCMKVKEGKYPPIEHKEQKSEFHLYRRFTSATKLYFHDCCSHSYYMLIFAALAVGGFAFVPVNLYSVPYARSLNLSMETYGLYLAITFAVSLALSYLLGVLADRYHPLRLAAGVFVLYLISCSIAGMVPDSPAVFALGFIAHGIISGTYYTATASLMQRLFPADRCAQFMSATGIVTSLVSVAATYSFGILLDQTGSNYQYTFRAGASLAVLSLVLFWLVYRRFLTFGGPSHYRAP